MNADEKAKLQQRYQSAAEKAVETKGPEERSRASKMASWTRVHGKDDAKNPYSKENYRPRSS